MSITEHQHQVSLFQWAELSKRKYPELKYMFAVPNGGLRDPVTAVKLRQEGVKAGVPDIMLPVARQGYHGLFIEMKNEKGRLSKAQERYLPFLNQNGYLAIVCYGWNEAKDTIEMYLA
jgi:hypothetical protein